MRPLVVTSVFLGTVLLAVPGCRSESEHHRMVRLVKETLKDEGIQAGVEPVVVLTGEGDAWVGTATYGDVVYDLRVYRQDGTLKLERQMRAPLR